MQWGSVIGLLVAFGGILFGQYMEGGHVGSLIQFSAFIIVLSGTLGAVILQSGLKKFISAVRMIQWIFFPPRDGAEEAFLLLPKWAAIVRREGLLQLENQLAIAPNRFYEDGIKLIADGADAERVGEILGAKIDAIEIELLDAVKVWDAAGGYAPTVGILGAVLGLIHVMENLSDPSKLGSGIAVAFVATIYGVGLANLVFLPFANNLKKTIARRVLVMEKVADGFSAIAKGDNPRIIESMMMVEK